MNDADVTFTFNDITLIVKPQHDPADVVNAFWMQSATKRDAWVRSEEGIKSLVAQLESRKRAEAAEKEPLATFALRDAEGWRKCIDNNSDGYGSCCRAIRGTLGEPDGEAHRRGQDDRRVRETGQPRRGRGRHHRLHVRLRRVDSRWRVGAW
jgi:hypothetical protein